MSQKEHGEVRSTSGTLKGVYHYLNSPSPHLFPFVFISNVTDSLQMFRVCKNGKPIAFPVLLPNQYKIVYIKDSQNVSSCDEITVTEHLEEYIYDESELD